MDEKDIWSNGSNSLPKNKKGGNGHAQNCPLFVGIVNFSAFINSFLPNVPQRER